MRLPTRDTLSFAATAAMCCGLMACSSVTPSLRHYRAPDSTASATTPRVAVVPPAFTIQIDGAADVTESEREQVRREVEQNAMTLVVEALRQRGYEPTLADVSRAQDAVRSLSEGFVYHANAVAAGAPEGGHLDPALVQQVAGGADAVLYVNGSAVTVSNGKRAAQAVVVVLIAALIAAVVVLVVLAVRDTAGGGGLAPSGSHAAVPATAAVGRVAPAAHFHSSLYSHWAFAPVYWVPPPDVYVPHRHATEPSPSSTSPPPRAERGFFDGADMRFFATLVDAATGKILWHVDQVIDADAGSASELRDSIQQAFSTLPQQVSAAR